MEFKTRLNIFCVFILILCVSLCAANSKSDEKGNIYTFMTYNIHHGEGLDGVLDIDRIAEIIRSSGAQIIGLQEVDREYGDRSNFEKQAEVLADKLGMHFVYGPAKNDKYGNAILSKYPIIESQNHRLFNMDNFEQRACIEAKIKTPVGIFTVLVTHIDHSTDELMLGQISDILKITDDKEKMVLLGDFNEQAPPYKQPSLLSPIISKYGYVFDIVGMLETTTVVKYNRRIDHIFVSKDLEANIKNSFTLKDSRTYIASDHFPVIVTLEFSAVEKNKD